MVMEFFIACAPENHRVIPGIGGFRAQIDIKLDRQG
jgi:hypothetical protein